MSDKSETIDPKTFRKGDRVWVEGTIDENGLVSLGGRWKWLSALTIVKHIPSPRPIAVGDRVMDCVGPTLGRVESTVIHIHDDVAWIKYSFGTRLIPVHDLERVEP